MSDKDLMGTHNYKSQWEVAYKSETQIACIKAGLQVIDGDCVAP